MISKKRFCQINSLPFFLLLKFVLPVILVFLSSKAADMYPSNKLYLQQFFITLLHMCELCDRVFIRTAINYAHFLIYHARRASTRVNSRGHNISAVLLWDARKANLQVWQIFFFLNGEILCNISYNHFIIMNLTFNVILVLT